jgi:hypothetical protein
MDASQAAGGTGILQLLEQIHTQYGLLVLMLVVIIGFGFCLFWKLVWKVWRGALIAKNEEIARLASDRDIYRALHFDSLRSAKPRTPGDRSSENRNEGGL